MYHHASTALTVTLVLLVNLVLFAQPVVADTSDATVARLTATIEALTARLEALEARVQAPAPAKAVPEKVYAQAPVSAPPAAKASWTDTIKVSGDFRYRHEGFEVDNRRDRHRQRMRARALVTGEVSDTVTAGFGLASGGSDPISTNQTFDDASSSKNVVIDLAYVDWQTSIDGLSVQAGKFKNPMHRAGGNGLIWDGDLRPEGLATRFKRGGFFANGLASWVDESSSDDDSFLLGGQFGVKHKLSDGTQLVVGASYINVLDARGETAFFNGDAQGNLLTADGRYVSGFEIVEGFVEYSFGVNGASASVFADFVQNLAADDYDQGYAIGGKLKHDKWSFGYTWQDLEADAVLGTFTDSDFIGGGTDGKGHILQAGYSLTKRIGLKGTLFLNERGVDFGPEEDFKRLMLDISFKY